MPLQLYFQWDGSSKKVWQVIAKVSELFSKLVFSIDFSAFASVCGFFLTEILLIAWIWILQLERPINLVTRETSLSSADSYTAWSGTSNYHIFAFSA